MVPATGSDSGGKRSKTTIKATHAQAMVPMGKYHLPSENGPGTSLPLPEVIRRKTGVTYEVYRPITAALDTVGQTGIAYDRADSSPSEGGQRRLRESKQAADCSEDHDEPHCIDRCLRAVIDTLPPAAAGEGVIARKREYDTASVDALRGASDELYDDDEAPEREHTAAAEHVEEELGHGEREVAVEEARG